MEALTPAALALRRRVSPLTPPCLPAVPSPTTRTVRWPLCQSPQRHRSFQASPLSSRLATASRRIGFVLLRTGGSPPAAPHPASRRRSCLRLHSYDLLWRGLAPRRQSVLADALDGRDKPGHDAWQSLRRHVTEVKRIRSERTR